MKRLAGKRVHVFFWLSGHLYDEDSAMKWIETGLFEGVKLHEGETLNGTVTKVMEFGAFVDLGGVEGLIPAREVAWERVEDLNTVLKAGDGVTVKIIKLDLESQKITLSRKECMSRVFKRSPEDEAAAKSAAEVAAWMEENAKKNSGFGCGAFDKL